VDEAVRLTREVAAALEYAHCARGRAPRPQAGEHPLGADGGALLADFGIARASADLRATQALTGHGVSVGTPTYMSPEQATADPSLDGRRDQYSRSRACSTRARSAGRRQFTAKTAPR
jgi:serine/threonine-protein kinase